jgi:hypothetical protein
MEELLTPSAPSKTARLVFKLNRKDVNKFIRIGCNFSVVTVVTKPWFRGDATGEVIGEYVHLEAFLMSLVVYGVSYEVTVY